MSEATDKRRETMLKKYGGEAGLKKHYQELQKKSREHPNNKKGIHIGGFSNPDLAKRAGELGRARRYGKDV